ncbi:hypothetical protein PVK06_034442 [Gossypium arboreum]|uniref:Uncharacterized protein n=1 Tax=Gossypium arboreum TaxID=29729 RepID=A0ABR0NEK3_GOSAR|nr:hypothetical protein PVK06_034442 [Gossypium arboreum]
MNAHVNGEEDGEEKIEDVARSTDASDKDDDVVPEENVDDADDDESNRADPEISKREKDRLKEMQKLKNQKIQEILILKMLPVTLSILGKRFYSVHLKCNLWFAKFG